MGAPFALSHGGMGGLTALDRKISAAPHNNELTRSMGATFTIAPLLLWNERRVESDRPVHAWEQSHATTPSPVYPRSHLPRVLPRRSWVPPFALTHCSFLRVTAPRAHDRGCLLPSSDARVGSMPDPIVNPRLSNPYQTTRQSDLGSCTRQCGNAKCGTLEVWHPSLLAP